LEQGRQLQFMAVFHCSIAATRIAGLASHCEAVTAHSSFSLFLFCCHRVCHSRYAGASVDSLLAQLQRLQTQDPCKQLQTLLVLAQ
jgi:hypothetical protein